MNRTALRMRNEALLEAVALAVAQSGTFERLEDMPQPVIDKLYENGWTDLHFDYAQEAWVHLTEAGEARLAELLKAAVE